MSNSDKIDARMLDNDKSENKIVGNERSDVTGKAKMPKVLLTAPY